MDAEKEKLWDSTGNAHSNIHGATFDLLDIARKIEYLHPRLADEIEIIARMIEHDRKTIQGNTSQLINMDLKRSQNHMGEILVALLDNSVRNS